MVRLALEGRVVLVTGAGGGIGRAHARLLASRGAAVVVNDLGSSVHGDEVSESVAERCVKEIRDAGGEATASTSSIATPEGGAQAVACAIDTYGRLDGVIHNAGILRDRAFLNLSAEDVDQVLAVHLLGGFHVFQPAFRTMKEQRHGRLVVTSSSSGLFGNFGQANYAAAKMGLVGLMHVLAIEGQRYGITANALAPTARTRMTENLLGDLADQLDPEHVAAVGAYLVSAECEVTHHIFSVGGGRVARIFVGVTPGWSSWPATATPDAIAEHVGEIVSLDGYVVPSEGADEVALIKAALERS